MHSGLIALDCAGTRELSSGLAQQLHVSQPEPPAAEQEPPDRDLQPNGRAQAPEEDEEEEEDLSSREAELRRIYDELSKEDARCVPA